MMMMMVFETDTQSSVIKVGGDGGGFITARSQTAFVSAQWMLYSLCLVAHYTINTPHTRATLLWRRLDYAK